MLSQPRSLIEQCILVELITFPRSHAWEIQGLEPALFADPKHRAVAEALCFLRDRGRPMRFRPVRLLRHLLKPKGLADYVTQLVRHGFGCHGSLTVYVSQLHWYAARKGKAA
jgi:hypothetical protein